MKHRLLFLVIVGSSTQSMRAVKGDIGLQSPTNVVARASSIRTSERKPRRLEPLVHSGLSLPMSVSTDSSAATSPLARSATTPSSESMISPASLFSTPGSSYKKQVSFVVQSPPTHVARFSRARARQQLAAVDAAYKKGGLVVGVSPREGSVFMHGEIDPVLLSPLSVPPGGKLIHKFTDLTFENFKRMWTNGRYKLYLLRQRLMAFRAYYTRRVNSGKTDQLLEECNESSGMATLSLFRPLRKVYKTLEDIVSVYIDACKKYEEAITHAQKICMGERIDLDFSAYSFGVGYEFPSDSPVLNVLNRPVCVVCSERKGSRVMHPNFNEDSLDFVDECSWCGASFLQEIYLYEVVYDPAVRAIIDAPGLGFSAFVSMADAYNSADNFLKRIFLSTCH